MSKEQLEYMEKTVTLSIENRKDPIWLRAFAEYNETHDLRIDMGCRPCYVKVYLYLKNKYV